MIPAPLPGIAGGGDYGTGDTTRETWGAAGGYTRTLTDHSFNEFRVGFNQLSTSVGVPLGGTYIPPANLQVPGVPLDPRVNGLTVFAPDSYSFIGDPEFNPTYTGSQELQFADTVTYLVGNHNVRGGASVRQSKFDLFQIPQPRGAFRFSGEFTGDPLGDAFLGYASQTDIQNITDVKNTTWYYAAFLQDDWRVTNNLTLNVGLRYEYTSATTESLEPPEQLRLRDGPDRGGKPERELARTHQRPGEQRRASARVRLDARRNRHLGRSRRLGHVLQQPGAAHRVPARLQSAVLLLDQPFQ